MNTLYAILELARRGYIFQVNALLRLVIECTTHIEYVWDPSTDAKHKEKVAEYAGVEQITGDQRRQVRCTIRA